MSEADNGPQFLTSNEKEEFLNSLFQAGLTREYALEVINRQAGSQVIRDWVTSLVEAVDDDRQIEKSLRTNASRGSRFCLSPDEPVKELGKLIGYQLASLLDEAGITTVSKLAKLTTIHIDRSEGLRSISPYTWRTLEELLIEGDVLRNDDHVVWPIVVRWW